MTLAGKAHRMDVLASRLPVSFQRWLGVSFLITGVGILALIDAVWLPRMMFLPPDPDSVVETKPLPPASGPKNVVARISPPPPATRPVINNAILSAPDLPPLIFLKNNTKLAPDSQVTLAKVQAFLEENPKVRVVLSGHTDDQGTDYLNNSLSLERAQEAHDWLVFHGIHPSRIHTQGFGSADPLLPSRSPQARARNRRVEITFR
jgi:outer membrane protein OmpA-like peptidoglycan-associated protein